MCSFRAPHSSGICSDRSAGAAWLRGSRALSGTWNFTEPENVCSAKWTLMLNGSGSFWIESGLGVEISSKHTNYREEKNNRRRTKTCLEGFPKNKQTSSATDQINCLLLRAQLQLESLLWARQHTLISIPAGICTAHSEHWQSDLSDVTPPQELNVEGISHVNLVSETHMKKSWRKKSCHAT